jgi:hypothetical protein
LGMCARVSQNRVARGKNPTVVASPYDPKMRLRRPEADED